jgi:hypothetical protein
MVDKCAKQCFFAVEKIPIRITNCTHYAPTLAQRFGRTTRLRYLPVPRRQNGFVPLRRSSVFHLHLVHRYGVTADYLPDRGFLGQHPALRAAGPKSNF